MFINDFSENWQKQLLNDQKALAKVSSKVSNTWKETDTWTRHDTFSKGSVIKNDFLVLSIFCIICLCKIMLRIRFFYQLEKLDTTFVIRGWSPAERTKTFTKGLFRTSNVFKDFDRTKDNFKVLSLLYLKIFKSVMSVIWTMKWILSGFSRGRMPGYMILKGVLRMTGKLFRKIK